MRAVSAAVRSGPSGAGRPPRATANRSAVRAWAGAGSAASASASGTACAGTNGRSGAAAVAGSGAEVGAGSGAGPKTRGSLRVWKSRSEAVSTVRTALSRTAWRRYSAQARPSHTSAAAPESRRTWPTSPDLYMGLRGTTTAPAFQAPRTASTKCGVFWSMTATRSPRRTPRAARWPATESESASASA